MKANQYPFDPSGYVQYCERVLTESPTAAQGQKRLSENKLLVEKRRSAFSLLEGRRWTNISSSMTGYFNSP
jgi:hypothetical protein